MKQQLSGPSVKQNYQFILHAVKAPLTNAEASQIESEH